jgi:serine/threonine protein kinase
MTEPLRDSDPQEVGGFALEGRLGAGGMGTVYLARSPSGEPRAIKVLHAELSGSPELRARLEREAAVLQRLRGDRSAAVYEVNAMAERPYLVMEYVPGLSLDKHIAKYGKLSGVLAWAVMDALLEATEMFHAEGITHRDLKPSNVMLGGDGVKIIDFGISGLAGSSLTEVGTGPATTLWSSPEQMNGAAVGPSSDVFNLGMVFAFAWTGKHPFDAAKRDAVMLKLMTGEPNLEGVPSRLHPLIIECLRKNPAERPSVAQVRASLGTISRSGSGSNSGSAGSSDAAQFTGTVIVDVQRQLDNEAARRLDKRNSSKTLKPISIGILIGALVVGGIGFSALNSGSDTPQETSIVGGSSDNGNSKISEKSLADFEAFPRVSDGGVADPRGLVIDLTSVSRFQAAGTGRAYNLRWFASKCRAKLRTVESFSPIRMQFSTSDPGIEPEFVVVLTHLRKLLQVSASPLADQLDGNFELVRNGQTVSAIFSSIQNGNAAGERNRRLMELFNLVDDESRPIRIVLSDISATEVDGLSATYEPVVRSAQSGLPSGVAVDYGWAVPFKRKTSFNPKEIDAAVVTFSREYWDGVTTEQRLLVLARGMLLALGATVDENPSSILSVKDGLFSKDRYEFGDADLQITAELGYQETPTC